MTRALTPEEEAYSKRLYDKLLDAIVTLDAVPGAESGLVSPHIVRATLADLAATIDHNCGQGATGNERRRHADFMAARYGKMLKMLQEAAGHEAWPEAQRVQ